MKSKLITADMRAVVMERSQTKSTRFRPLLTSKYLGICDEIPLMLSGAKAESFYYVKYVLKTTEIPVCMFSLLRFFD